MISSGKKFIEHHVAHHFDTAQQEFDSAKIGMWFFIAQEVLFFSALFVAYGIFRAMYPEMFLEASHLLSWKMGGLNTLFLVTSSFTMVMAVRSSQISDNKNLLLHLCLTFMFATFFLVVKYFEYAAKFEHGLLPAQWFSAEGVNQTLPIFFGLYFFITGLHGIHVLIGMGLIAWLIYRAYRREFHSEFFTPVEMVGLYWHVVDIIWIFIFPLLYLIR